MAGWLKVSSEFVILSTLNRARISCFILLKCILRPYQFFNVSIIQGNVTTRQILLEFLRWTCQHWKVHCKIQNYFKKIFPIIVSIISRQRLDKFIKDKNYVELSSSLSKDIRRQKGIVYQSDVIDEENELIVQHRLLLKKSYFYRMIFLGEYLLARIFLESLGVGDKKINYLLKKTSALKKDITFNYLPLINLQDNMRHINLDFGQLSRQGQLINQ